jgi:hypothetical protein
VVVNDGASNIRQSPISRPRTLKYRDPTVPGAEWADLNATTEAASLGTSPCIAVCFEPDPDTLFFRSSIFYNKEVDRLKRGGTGRVVFMYGYTINIITCRCPP